MDEQLAASSIKPSSGADGVLQPAGSSLDGGVMWSEEEEGGVCSAGWIQYLSNVMLLWQIGLRPSMEKLEPEEAHEVEGTRRKRRRKEK